MTLVNTLQSQGITLSMVQLTILSVIAVYIVGMYWKILLTGAAVVGVAIVLLHSEHNSPVGNANANANADIVVPKSMKVPKDFIADCVKGAEYTKAECEKIWSSTDIEEPIDPLSRKQSPQSEIET
jgi:hypothetical protein